jgi:hypothetical protein
LNLYGRKNSSKNGFLEFSGLKNTYSRYKFNHLLPFFTFKILQTPKNSNTFNSRLSKIHEF